MFVTLFIPILSCLTVFSFASSPITNGSSVPDTLEESAESVRRVHYFPSGNPPYNERRSAQVQRRRVPQSSGPNIQQSRPNHPKRNVDGEHFRAHYIEGGDGGLSPVAFEEPEPVSYSRVFYQTHPPQAHQQAQHQSQQQQQQQQQQQLQQSAPQQTNRRLVEDFQERRPGERFHTKLYDDEQIYECVLASDTRKNHNKQSYRQPEMGSKHENGNFHSPSNEIYSETNSMESRAKTHPKYKPDIGPDSYNNNNNNNNDGGRFKSFNSQQDMYINRDGNNHDEDHNGMNGQNNKSSNLENILTDLRYSLGKLLCPDNSQRCLQSANIMSSSAMSSSPPISTSAEQELPELENTRMNQLVTHLMLSKKLIDMLENTQLDEQQLRNIKSTMSTMNKQQIRFVNSRRLDMIPFEESDSIVPHDDKFRSGNSPSGRSPPKRKHSTNYHSNQN